MGNAHLEAARSLLETVLGCPVALTDATRDSWTAFEAAYCFDPALQPTFTAAYLAGFVSRMDRRVVHEVQEPLGLSITLVWVAGSLAVIGPYTAHAILAGDAEALLGGLRIAGAHLQPYKLYRARFAIVDSEYVMRAARAMAEAAGLSSADLGYERVAVAAHPIAPGADEAPRSAPFERINERYALENDYLQAIASGDERAALAALERMADVPQPPSYLQTPYLGATILRILTRVAAQQGGLPPVTIDAISQTYAQRLHSSGHVPDSSRTVQAVAAMVHEFCLHIRRYRQQPYSGLVRQVIDEIELHLSHNVSPRDLARRLHVSESHLARRFKAETGHTISEHVATERANRAAHLLAATNQPVRDIAAYVGYLDANYFVKVFKTIYGQTPTAYRNELGVWRLP